MNARLAALLCGMSLLFALIPTQPATADTPPMPVTATAQSDDVPFPDVPEDSWMYDAVRQLAKDGYLVGYPDGTLKGARPMTRYEASYLVNKVVTAMKDQIAKGQQPPPDDVALINKLAASLSAELKDLSQRVDTLQQQTTALKKQADLSTRPFRSRSTILPGRARSIRTSSPSTDPRRSPRERSHRVRRCRAAPVPRRSDRGSSGIPARVRVWARTRSTPEIINTERVSR